MTAPSLPRQKLRIIHLIPTLNGGGAERQVRYIASASAALGHSVAIASKMTVGEADDLKSLGIIPYMLSGQNNFDPMLIVQTILIIRKMKADIIQTWLPQCDVLGAVGSLITGVPMILSERSSATAYPKGWRQSLRHLAGKHAKMIIANSPSGRDFWDGHKNRLVIPNAVPSRNADKTRGVHIPQRRPSSKIIICAGRLAKEKNIQQIISAVPYLLTSDIQLIIVGDGPEQQALKRLTVAIDQTENIIFLGHQPDIYPWLKEAALFVSASTFEGHPNTVLEAAQAGTPLLLSDIRMHRDTVGGGASYFPLHDERRLAVQIDAILNDRQSAVNRADIAKVRIQQLTVAKVTDMYLTAYRSLCDPLG